MVRPSSPSATACAANGTPAWKHGLDVVCVIVCLPLWLPVMALTALFIKIVSPGPVFFTQQRIGYRGHPFVCFKFRSMKVNAETKTHEAHLAQLLQSEKPMTKLDAADPRLIPLGRVLRATGLDELPQLFNVLRREMSLVGPRPCTPYELQHYQPWQLERLNVLPGLTGYWQVNGKNSTTFNEMIGMDLFYVRHLSFWRDLMILLKTAPVLFAQLWESRAPASARAA